MLFAEPAGVGIDLGGLGVLVGLGAAFVWIGLPLLVVAFLVVGFIRWYNVRRDGDGS